MKKLDSTRRLYLGEDMQSLLQLNSDPSGMLNIVLACAVQLCYILSKRRIYFRRSISILLPS